MKKIISLLLCLVIPLIFNACGSETEAPATSYDDLLTKLEASVSALFADDFDTKLNEEEFVSPTGELTDKWTSMLREAKTDFRNVDKNAFGYRLIDINSDGSSELFFMRSDDRILAVFTLVDGVPLLIDAFNRSYQCVLRDTGELYTMSLTETGGYEFNIYTLDASTGTLLKTVSFGMGDVCYEMQPTGTYTTSSERISELREQYPFEQSSILSQIELILF